MTSTRPVSGFALALVVALVPIAMLTFATGFFPYKPFLPGLAEYHDLAPREPPTAPFDRLIFMVIDALRSDFVFSHTSGFRFTQGLIRDGSALPFTAHAQAPTVTMPRVKALTTGSIPSFLDMILNLAESDTSSTLAAQDTWLAQMGRNSKGKLIMYGDDTWLKLFPNTFARADGTSSFFVSDFTEVDHNVTRHVPKQLQQTDWNAMILHYLGMDHIGHKSGPRSVNMLPKQNEMDDIVKQIYKAMENQSHLESTILILCGDHGMNDVGNHGGSAPGETSPALLFVSPKLRKISQGKTSPLSPVADFDYYDKVEQSDVVPTLAGLLGFPVPLNNLGVFIPELLGLWSHDDDQMQLLYRNALQLLNMVKATFPHASYITPDADLPCSSPSDTVEQLACLWKAVNDGMNAIKPMEGMSARMHKPLLEFCRKAQSSLSSTASNYNAARLYAGIAVVTLAAHLAFFLVIPSFDLRHASADFGIIALAVAYISMMFASSYVEEEQQFWYWTSSLWAMMPTGQWCTSRAISSLVIASSLRILRRWNQSGQKYAGSPDIGNTFLPQHPALLFTLVILTYVYIAQRLVSATFRPIGCSLAVSRLLAIGLTTPAIIFKALFTLSDSPELFRSIPVSLLQRVQHGWTIQAARLVYAGLGTLLACVGAYGSRQYISGSRRVRFSRALGPPALLLLCTQSRASKIPQQLVWAVLSAFTPPPARPASAALRSLVLAHMAFFANGGTNGISSIDLASAYNGLSTYHPALTACLCYIGNFGPAHAGGCIGSASSMDLRGWFPLWDSTKGTKLDDSSASGAREKQAKAAKQAEFESWKQRSAYLAFFMSCMVTGVMGACCALRTHLFVWTVFSPKFLYAAAWFGGWFVGGEVAVRGALAWLDCL